jgi:hypothetical protein
MDRRTEAFKVLGGVALNWLRVSLERKRDVKKRYSVGAQERFEGCEKGDGYAFRR